VGTFNIYLLDIIETPRQFLNAIEVLQAASEDDTVVIHLQTGGGSLDATDMFIQAMRECEGTIIVKASGGVHSAGTVILLEADQFSLSENFNCLIHNGSCGSGGKFSDFKSEAKFTQEYMERVMHATYRGFLSNEEILALLDGKDYWFFAEEFAARFEARNTLLQAEYEAEQAAMLALAMQED
jgi:ATP-dependent protease ClpP protease subunit